MCRFYFIISLLLSVFVGVEVAYGQAVDPLAFPGADGFGKYTTGGRGGRVLIVDNLNDSGPGSLRKALKAKGPRIVVFEVSGNIALESILDVNNGNLTIAGQSAPGGGICIKNFPIKIKSHNVIIRHVRFRLGDERKVQEDCMSIMRQKNIIIDHCSFSWGTDETATFYDNENFTLQWSVISESLNNSVHEKGEHGYGGIWGGKKASFHHNLLAHHTSRNPRFCGSRYHKQPETEVVDFRNNVIYNWKENSTYGGEEGNHNLVNNYYKPGPATNTSKKERILNPFEPFGKFYLSGNIYEGNKKITNDNSEGVVAANFDKTELLTSPISFELISSESADEAFTSVLKGVGANFPRDAVDTRIIEDVQNKNGSFGKQKNGIIDSQQEVGGWPVLTSKKPKTDTDRDGMPDDWEKANGLNPNDLNDGSGTDLHNYYTNIEVYLNSLTALNISNE